MTETSSASSLSASCIGVGLFTLAMSTLMPFCNMGVITMKMISSTNITSTIGVTLMSELTLAPSFRLANAIDFSVEQLPAASYQLPAKPRAVQTHWGTESAPPWLGRPTLGCSQRRSATQWRTTLGRPRLRDLKFEVFKFEV